MPDEIYQNDDDDEGGGDWIVTFADMATLLMAFFVLLLSFAEMDVTKYQAVVGSMKHALGVEAKSEKKYMKVEEESKATAVDCPRNVPDKNDPDPSKTTDQIDEVLEEEAQVIRQKLSKIIDQSLVTIERTSNFIVIRLPEKGMFGAGTAAVSPRFKPIIAQIRTALEVVAGDIIVAGHTDERPIKNRDYRSNWDLSAERAVSVLHELLDSSQLQPEKLSAVGYGSSRPLVANKDNVARSRNRRVEIIVKKRVETKPKKMVVGADASSGSDASRDASGSAGPDAAKAEAAAGADATSEAKDAAAPTDASAAPGKPDSGPTKVGAEGKDTTTGAADSAATVDQAGKTTPDATATGDAGVPRDGARKPTP